MAKDEWGNTIKEHRPQCSTCMHCKPADNCCELTGLYVPSMRQRLPDFNCRSYAEQCPTCRGTGEVFERPFGELENGRYRKCVACSGTGRKDKCVPLDSRLYKTTIVIWSDFNPTSADTKRNELALMSMGNEEAYCSAHSVVAVPIHKLRDDKDWDGTDFFDAGEEKC